MCIRYVLFTHLSTDGHLGCFYLFTIMNNAAINIHVQVSIWILDFILIVSLPYLANTGCPVKSEFYVSNELF